MSAPADPSAWRVAGHIASWRRRQTLVGGAVWILFFVSAMLPGLVYARFFDAFDSTGGGVYGWAVGLVAAEVARRLVVHRGALWWNHAWVSMEHLQRANMLGGQVASGGEEAATPVRDPGEAMSRFRDDPTDVAWFVDNWVDLTGAVLMTTGALAVMGAVDWRVPLVVLVPVGFVVVASRWAAPHVAAARRADLTAASGVTGVLRDAFSARDLVVAHGSVDHVVGEVGRRCEVRRRAAVRNRVLTEVVRSVSRGAGEVGIGLVLVVVAGPVRRGEVSIGSLALFTAYISYLTMFPRMLALTLTRRHQSDVALARMRRLVADRSLDRLSHHREFPFDSPTEPVVEDIPPAPTPVLDRLLVGGLTVRFGAEPDDVVIGPIDLDLGGGTMTVLTGPVGSGKTSLLRGLLGLVPASADISWNGERVDDPASFFVPPRAAYLAQVPQLFSAALGDNIRLGRRLDDAGIVDVLALVDMGEELTGMRTGLATEIGARGIRLSGGQRQRVAAARAIASRPALLVVDDLSSALDVRTELLVWERVRASGITVLATSTRPVALELADRVIVLPDRNGSAGGQERQRVEIEHSSR